MFDMLVVGLLGQLKRMRILLVSKVCTVLTTMFSCVRTGEGEKAGFNSISNSNSAKNKVVTGGKSPPILLRVAVCYIVPQYTV